MKKIALIDGITGQDGSYLAELLLEKDYEVHGIIRRSSSINTSRIDHIFDKLNLHYGDVTDSLCIDNIVSKVKPDEVYHLAAQSHVAVSFELPEYTGQVDAMGTLKILEAIRKHCPKAKFYNACTSELYGKVQEIPQKETTPFYPRSPYGVAKLYSFWISKNYREAYDMFTCNGILFNHECLSPNMPLILKNKKTDVITIKEVGEFKKVKQKGKNIQQWVIEDTLIWDGNSFVDLKYITATKRNELNEDFICKTINTRNGVVKTTNHHNLLDENSEKIKLKNVKIGDKLLHGRFPINKEISKITKEEAEFMGLMVGDGSVDSSGKGKFTNNNKKIMNRFIELYKKVCLGNVGCENVHFLGYGKTTSVNLAGNPGYLRLLYQQIYNKNKFKKIPDIILNANSDIQKSFLIGYNLADGLKSNNCTYEFKNFKTNSPVLAQGLLFLLNNTTKQKFNITFEEDEKYYGYYSINLLSPNNNNVKKKEVVKEFVEKGMSQREISRQTNISRNFIRKVQNEIPISDCNYLEKDKTEIKKIVQNKKQPDFVYDIETDSGKLMAGIGCTVISNSPVRGDTFVTKKITNALKKIAKGEQEKLSLGNLDAKRDWGYAKDYVYGMWLMLQQDKPDDFVLATNETHSVREFIEEAVQYVGIEIEWKGEGLNEVGVIRGTDRVIVDINSKYFRPAEVDILIGDASKAKKELGWEPETTFKELVKIMMTN